MSLFKWFVLFLGIAGVTGCVAPVYHTAEVTPGTNFYVGGGPALIYRPEARPSHEPLPEDTSARFWVGRLDAQALFGLSERFALTAHVGSYFSNSEYYIMYYGYEIPGLSILTTPFAYGGLQYEFRESPSVALKLEGGVPNLVNLKLLFGANNIKGREHWTLGLILLPWPGLSLTYRPHDIVSIYISGSLPNPGFVLQGDNAELFTMGLGFKLW